MPDAARPEAWRLFVAVPLPASVRDAVADALAPLRESVRARWVRPEGLHVTLGFLGNVTVADVPEIARRAGVVAADRGPFRASLGTAGAFGRGSRPAAVWLGIEEGSADLVTLAELTAHNLMSDATRRAAPHVTVAREVSQADVGRFPDALAPLRGIAWSVDAAVLFRSHLGAGGSRYEAIATLPLRGRDATR